MVCHGTNSLLPVGKQKTSLSLRLDLKHSLWTKLKVKLAWVALNHAFKNFSHNALKFLQTQYIIINLFISIFILTDIWVLSCLSLSRLLFRIQVRIQSPVSPSSFPSPYACRMVESIWKLRNTLKLQYISCPCMPMQTQRMQVHMHVQEFRCQVYALLQVFQNNKLDPNKLFDRKRLKMVR